ncbi:hypothetical protein TWF679_002018 [Orbilia oligospora]|uniref:3-phytase n=1 Tax=Orbilia oligospora TaxID=2813651 RepID=A0A8H8UUE9_ORBOL|nr:hypothetical protein TWF679_002018 [Orbilia oligospora]
MKSSHNLSGLILLCLIGYIHPTSATNKFSITLPITARTSSVESDSAAVYYPSKSKYSPIFIGNDGSAETGGFHAYELYGKRNDALVKEVGAYKTGRSKLVEVVYGEDKDFVVTLSMSDGMFRVFEVDGKNGVRGLKAEKLVRGDFSAMCTWKSKIGEYVYVLGKRWGYRFLVREKKGGRGIEVVQTQEFGIPIEPNSCTVSPEGKVFLAGDSGKVFSFLAVDETAAPKIAEVGELGGGDEVKGLKIYYGKKDTYLLVGLEDGIEVFDIKKLGSSLGKIQFDDEELEVGDFAVHQTGAKGYEDGSIVFAGEDGEGKFFGVSSLTPLFTALGKGKVNTKYDPRDCTDNHTKPKKCANLSDCNGYGYCPKDSRDRKATCDCFPGLTGKTCNKITCPSNCTSPSHGTCTGPNTCTCIPPFTGENCATLAVPARYETEESGGADGDDPAIWVHPTDKTKSRIITTVKSEVGSGLGVYDLKGKRTGGVSGGEPNNVDVLYGVEVAGRKVDLAVAACRADDTICMYEITPTGDLVTIPGGVQPLPPAVKELEKKFKVYGSCVYHSPKTGAYHIFVNSKSSLYLQFQLSATTDGKLNTILVRHFYAGNRGQVEGCVVDDENSRLFLGEEPYGLWSYDAEPDQPAVGTLVDNTVVDGGKLHADVEGVTLVYGKTKKEGYIIVSCQGYSEYNIYQRHPPHEFVVSFSIPDNKEKGVDRVTNTDGITAVGTNLGKEWPYGMVVVHDDVNEAAGGGVRADATFKIVGLGDILGNEAVKELGLLKGVDENWDPRK